MNQWKVGQIRVKSGYTPAPKAPAPGGPRDPAADRQLLQSIEAAAAGQDFARAAAMADAALKGGLEHPLVLNLAALKCEQEGRFDDALRVLERAIAIAPDDIGARNAKGLVLTRLERYPEALATFDGVVELIPEFAGAHCARGASLEAMGRPVEAEAAYRHALELEPENLGATQGVANLLSRRGAHAEARPLAEAVLEAEPNFPDAVMVLAAADVAEGHAARAEQRLQMLAGDARLSPHQRALAHGQLGDALDAQDRVDDAAHAYTTCNQALLQAYAPVHGRGASALDFARAMLAELDAIPVDAWREAPGAAGSARTHAFLLGFPGSGRAALDAIAGHADVEVLEERNTLDEAQAAFMADAGGLRRLAAAGEAELAPLRAAYWDRVAAEGARPADKVFVDAHPLNVVRLPLILKLFPDARILLAQRDPRDVVLDCWRRRFVMNRSAYQMLTLPGTAAYYDAAMAMAERLRPAIANLTVVRHEDGDAAIRAMSDALRLASPPASPAPAAAEDAAGTWRRYGAQMAVVAPTLAPWVAKFGYEAE